MPIETLITLITFVSVIAALVTNRVSADLVLLGALTILVTTGVLTPNKALAGFSSPGLLTIACLYVIAAGLMESGAVYWASGYLFGSSPNPRTAVLKLSLPTSILSAVTNNTAVVAMFIPAVQAWAERLRISPSKLLIPLSYIAILGGTCTLIGTSTNLLVDDFLKQEYNYNMGMFEIAAIGVPITLLGCIYLVTIGIKLLPSHGGVESQITELREYCVEFLIEANSALVEKSIAEAGLRNLNSGYLIEIRRKDITHSAPPDWILQADDILVFIGAPNLSSELRKVRGLRAVDHDMSGLSSERNQRCLVEVVLGHEFPAIGQSVRESKFRSRYNAVVLSVSRDGNRLPGKIGNLKYKVGDMLLLEADFDFVDQYRFRKDFLLVSELRNSTPPDHRKAPIAMCIVVAMIASTMSGLTSILGSALLASGAMIITRCVSASKARRQIDLKVLAVIAGAFALGAAMRDTGAAAHIATTFIPENATPLLSLCIIYLLTVMFTEVITNNAAAILMLPIAQSHSELLGVSMLPFAVVIMIGASASFITPLGYQTNMMVLGPGRYKFTDFTKVGLPLSILVGITTILIVPRIWGF